VVSVEEIGIVDQKGGLDRNVRRGTEDKRREKSQGRQKWNK
jgi:hypothetical protein